MGRGSSVILWTVSVLLGLAGCAPASPGAPTSGASTGTGEPGPTKTIVLAQITTVQGYGVWDFSNTSGGGASLAEIHTMGLTTQDDRGSVAARIAARLPSFDDGSIALLPDGRMRTTWKLRPDVTWQDGAPFTADDVAFTFTAHTTPELRSSITAASPFIERVDVVDPLTAAMTWKTTFYNALDLNHRTFWLIPKHLLDEPLRSDKDAVLRLPYFTTDYVHLGPFRLVDWGMGETQVFERYDGYFLGRPRVDRIVIRTIGNPVGVLTNLKAGAIDMAAEKTLLSDAYTELRDE